MDGAYMTHGLILFTVHTMQIAGDGITGDGIIGDGTVGVGMIGDGEVEMLIGVDHIMVTHMR